MNKYYADKYYRNEYFNKCMSNTTHLNKSTKQSPKYHTGQVVFVQFIGSQGIYYNKCEILFAAYTPEFAGYYVAKIEEEIVLIQEKDIHGYYEKA